jgi:disulfide bond formation protein DsbB
MLALGTAFAAAVALAIAIGSETFAQLVPCALCLVERWPYRIAIAVGLVALILPRRMARAVLWLAVLALLAGAAAGFVHVGVEQRWWPSPLPECAAPQLSGGIADRLRQMPARPSKPCDDPTYLIPYLPISMAVMNVLYAVLTAFGLAGMLRGWRIRR